MQCLIEVVCSDKETAESIIKSEYCCRGGKTDASQSAVHKYEANGNEAFFSPSETVTRRLRIKRVSAGKAI